MKALLLVLMFAGFSASFASEIQGTDWTITTTSGSVATSDDKN